MGVYDNCYVDSFRFMAILDVSVDESIKSKVYFNSDNESLGEFVARVINDKSFSCVWFYDLSPFHASLIFRV